MHLAISLDLYFLQCVTGLELHPPFYKWMSLLYLLSPTLYLKILLKVAAKREMSTVLSM